MKQDERIPAPAPRQAGSLNRRGFLGSVGITTTLAGVAGSGLSLLAPGVLVAEDIGPVSDSFRKSQAFRLRLEAALADNRTPSARHHTNGDEELYARKIASFTKNLPHNALGEVDLQAYEALIHALSTGSPTAFEAIPFGGVRKLNGVFMGYNFALEGADSHRLGIAPPPAFDSAREASEIAEDYWQALSRDVPFANYASDPMISAAAADMSHFSDFTGPTWSGNVTVDTVFRGNLPGDLEGPYISQFLWLDVPFGATKIAQRYVTPVANDDHMTSYAEWLNVQNGQPLTSVQTLDPTPRYIRDLRGLSEYTHRDFSGQSALNASLILSTYGNAALDSNNPYLGALAGFGGLSFGPQHILDLLGRLVLSSLCDNFFQKWLVHRSLRPEEFGGRIQNVKLGAASYPIHPELFNSPVLEETFSRYGSYLLPQAYPEGSPAFPSYPAAHATVVGAGVTMLKAFFNESFVIPNPVVPSADDLSLTPYSGPDLTVGGELNKLASNIGVGGRGGAGVHWRSDGIHGLTLGEAMAISILADLKATYPEPFKGFSLTKFDGVTITV
jgi:hypothetical protein